MTVLLKIVVNFLGELSLLCHLKQGRILLMILSIYIIFGTYVSDAHKSMDSQREPESLTDSPFRDCSALAMFQF